MNGAKAGCGNQRDVGGVFGQLSDDLAILATGRVRISSLSL